VNTPSPYRLLRALADAAPLPVPPAFTPERWTGTALAPGPGPEPGPRLRTPAPMYPPTGYPAGAASYATAQQPIRRPHYEAIQQQHRQATEKAVLVDAPIERTVPPTDQALGQ
jgi:hypothetical protein